jgi:hypothetical protein
MTFEEIDKLVEQTKRLRHNKQVLSECKTRAGTLSVTFWHAPKQIKVNVTWIDRAGIKEGWIIKNNLTVLGFKRKLKGFMAL